LTGVRSRRVSAHPTRVQVVADLADFRVCDDPTCHVAEKNVDPCSRELPLRQ
jgi:hypothetical protein